MPELFAAVHYTVNFDARIGTHCGTCRTSDASIGIGSEGIVIATVIDLFRLQKENIGRTCNHAKVASFASLPIDGHRSINFCNTVEIIV